ncbi:MAG TPA: ATP-binding cassette domain-containing protein [Solirubrobacteraceae bacterium]|jgi:ABC-2 type transport system ATP-binding protein|nr:ATP-binding cassette domain-containing protein [Solirubrobacteraceae bacterium]
MTIQLAIAADALAKSYGSTRVLAGIDLAVDPGSVFALLGPNGAGKTTTVRILATLTEPDSGRARVAGHDVVAERHQVRRRISLTGQYAALDELQTGAENLTMMGRLRGLHSRTARLRAAELLTRFDLREAGGRRVATYSGGMRRRLDLAASLVADPEVIFLDEPTSGLDPRSRRALWDVVAGLKAAGVTVFLTTQYLDEADHLADRIAVLNNGRIVAEGSADELKRRLGSNRLELQFDDPAGYDAVTAALGARALAIDRASLCAGVATDGSAAEIRALLDELDPDGTRIARFELHGASLEDVFMSLTSEREITHA